MNIVIIGAGKFGSEIAKNLSLDKHNVIVVDTNASYIDNVVNQYDVNGFLGNGTYYQVLKDAGVEGFDFLIAVTGVDEINILSCIVAKHLNIKHTIARIRNKDYTKQFVTMKDAMGVDYAVNPDVETAQTIYDILKFPYADQIETFADGQIQIVGIKIKGNPTLVGCSLNDLRSKHSLPFLICVVKRGDEIIIPKGDFVLQDGDIIFITANREDMISSFKKLGLFKHQLKNIFIIGGGMTGEYVAEKLLEDRANVKIFEKSAARCDYLSDAMPKATILKSDGMDQSNLKEEGFENIDSVIAITGSDENNIVISAYAKQYQIKKVITKISNIDYDLVASSIGLDSLISPKDIFASSVLRYIRSFAYSESRSSEFINLHRLLNNRVEASEFEISKATGFTSTPLKDLRIRPSSLIFAILRDGEVITPKGNDTLEVGDRVFVISAGKFVNDLKEIF